MTDPTQRQSEEQTVALGHSKARLGFIGVGWVGRSRLKTLVDSSLAEVCAVADPDPVSLEAVASLAPDVDVFDSFSELLSQDLDGVVIATPNALHAEQCIEALNRGYPVFCQKPLGRNAGEVKRVIEAARRADRLLGVDLAYRWTRAVSSLRDVVHAGRIGKVFHANLTFHNAYGPDKPWSYDLKLAGGGCLIDVGVHLVDLALWVLGFPEIVEVTSRLYNKGVLLRRNSAAVEDFATVQLLTADNMSITLECSWNLHAGQDAAIAASFHGEHGAATFQNMNGSFYDFSTLLCTGARATSLAEPPDNWPGRAAVEWARMLLDSPRFADGAEEHLAVAEVMDRIYGREMWHGRIHGAGIGGGDSASRSYSAVGGLTG
jgi:predicted dehydrogenase